jgi:hypothetical protein
MSDTPVPLPTPEPWVKPPPPQIWVNQPGTVQNHNGLRFEFCGYLLSIQWGAFNYADFNVVRTGKMCFDPSAHVVGSSTVEIACFRDHPTIKGEREWIIWHQDEDSTKTSDVLSYFPVLQLPKLIDAFFLCVAEDDMVKFVAFVNSIEDLDDS